MTTATQNEIGKTIAAQLGNRFFFLVGGKNLVALETGLVFHFCRNVLGANVCQITLDGRDEYTMEFFRVRGLARTSLAKYDGLQVEGLLSCFECTTELCARF